MAEVVPIFKKGARDRPNNNRLASLTSVPSKVMESLIKHQLLRHVHEQVFLMTPNTDSFLGVGSDS